MSIARAIRYRRLALAQEGKATANLLLELADECDRGILCTAEWRSTRPSRKNEQLLKAGEPSSSLSGTHSMTNVETEPPAFGGHPPASRVGLSKSRPPKHEK
jgi:hypothetical protein